MPLFQLRAWLGALVATLALAVVAPPLLAAQAQSAITGQVNVNTASAQELQQLPGVGEARARAILSARKERGGFKSLDQLVEVKGVGQALLQRLRPHLTLTGKTNLKGR